MNLDWRPAGKSDAAALQSFVCTDPAKRNYQRNRGQWHPKPWEIEVQSHLRGRRPPMAHDEALLLGFDRDGLAAVTHFGFDDEGEHFIIFAAARAMRCARRRYGREAIEAALMVCQATKEAQGLACAVFTRVDPRNEPSQAALRLAGFEYLCPDGEYESWIHDLE